MTLAPVFLGSLGRRRMASLFSLLAIILGVALGMAVQAIHEAALNEFGRGVRTLAGEADLRLVGPASGFDEALFEQILRHPDIAAATPIVEIDAKLAGHDVPMGEAVTSYIDNALPSYSLDSKALAELNEEADSGVIDDESTYSDPDDDGYNPDDDPDAAVWSH